MALTDMQVRKAPPKEKEYRLADGSGLFLQVMPNGRKGWRFRYFFGGKENLISFGSYPDVSLAEARNRRQEARALVARGLDPASERKAAKEMKAELAANSFEAIAREWHENQVARKAWSKEHAETITSRLEKDIYPWIGKKPIAEVKAKEIKAILDRVRSRGVVETARRVLTIMGQIYRYAIMTGRAEYELTAGFRGYLPPTSKTRKHMAAVTDPKELTPLLRAMDSYEGHFPTQCALKLLPLLFVRPGELRRMEWAEIDLEAGEWNIPGPKMKMKQPHLVPLCRQAVEILKELQPLTGSGKYVFHSVRTVTRPMSDNTVNAAFRRMGFDSDTVTGHGFRATARTIMDELLGIRVDIIEHQLAHAVKDPNGRAYNRTAFLEQRRQMMQTWADYLDGLKAGAKVLPFKAKPKD